MKTLMMLLAMGTLVSGHWGTETRAEKVKRGNGAEEVTAKGDTEETKGRKAKRKAKSVGSVAGPDGVDGRITLTPVTDGSCDWKYKPVLLNPDEKRLRIRKLNRSPFTGVVREIRFDCASFRCPLPGRMTRAGGSSHRSSTAALE